jgi:hypothetical protein
MTDPMISPFFEKCPGCPSCAEARELATNVIAGKLARSDGKTIVDFLKVWLEQARDENSKQAHRIEELVRLHDEVHRVLQDKCQRVADLEAATRRLVEAARVANETLCHCAMLIDGWNVDAYPEWSEWDREVRNSITKAMTRLEPTLADPVLVALRRE